jgi:HAD superfamily hydrolase (TIGR01549 family)
LHSIRAILFDIGGTLRVTKTGEERDLSKVEEIIRILGENTPVDDFITRIRKGEKAYRRWCKPDYIELNEAELWVRFLLPEYPSDFIRANAVRFNQLWRESRRKHILPDMADTMRELSARGYKLGVISNTTSSVEGYQLLEETGLRELFGCVILSAEFGRRKPHPSLFIEAARRLGLNPQACAYVGDRPSRDLIGARQSNYGCAVIINTAGYVLDEYDPDDYDPEKDSHLVIKPDHHIHVLAELLNIFPPVDRLADTTNMEGPPVLFDVALSTMWHVDQGVSFNEAFSAANQIGIARFELNHQVTVEQLEGWDRDLHYAVTVHDPCPAVISLDELKTNDWLVSSTDEKCRLQGVDVVKRTIDLAVRLGSRSVVLHVGTVQCDRSRDSKLRKLYRAGLVQTPEYLALKSEMVAHRRVFSSLHLDAVKKSLEEIIEFSRGSSVALGIENRYRYYDIPLPDEMEELLGMCDESWFGFQLDTGHAVALDRLGLCSVDAWLERFNQRMIGVHLHDVDGITDHQVIGEGSVDFSLFGKYLPANCYRTMEINPKATLDQLAAGMERLVASGCIQRY